MTTSGVVRNEAVLHDGSLSGRFARYDPLYYLAFSQSVVPAISSRLKRNRFRGRTNDLLSVSHTPRHAPPLLSCFIYMPENGQDSAYIKRTENDELIVKTRRDPVHVFLYILYRNGSGVGIIGMNCPMILCS